MKAQESNTFFHKVEINSDGTPQKWRRNGKTKTWKRKPDAYQIPVKRGLYQFGYITHENIDNFTWR